MKEIRGDFARRRRGEERERDGRKGVFYGTVRTNNDLSKIKGTTQKRTHKTQTNQIHTVHRWDNPTKRESKPNQSYDFIFHTHQTDKHSTFFALLFIRWQHFVFAYRERERNESMSFFSLSEEVLS